MKRYTLLLLLCTQILSAQGLFMDLLDQCYDQSKDIKKKFPEPLSFIYYQTMGKDENHFRYDKDYELISCSSNGWEMHFGKKESFTYANYSTSYQNSSMPNYCAVDKFIIGYRNSIGYETDTSNAVDSLEIDKTLWIDSEPNVHQIIYPVTVYKDREEVGVIEENGITVLDPKAFKKGKVAHILREMQRIHLTYNNIPLRL